MYPEREPVNYRTKPIEEMDSDELFKLWFYTIDLTLEEEFAIHERAKQVPGVILDEATRESIKRSFMATVRIPERTTDEQKRQDFENLTLGELNSYPIEVKQCPDMRPLADDFFKCELLGLTAKQFKENLEYNVGLLQHNTDLSDAIAMRMALEPLPQPKADCSFNKGKIKSIFIGTGPSDSNWLKDMFFMEVPIPYAKPTYYVDEASHLDPDTFKMLVKWPNNNFWDASTSLKKFPESSFLLSDTRSGKSYGSGKEFLRGKWLRKNHWKVKYYGRPDHAIKFKAQRRNMRKRNSFICK